MLLRTDLEAVKVAVTPRVSIVMPLFDDEEYVAAALDSCLAQSLHEIEVLCVDDASADGTVSIVEQYRGHDPRIRLIRLPQNKSAFQARRAGIEAAAAPYVLFLDGDDELAPDAAKHALTKAESARADVVGFGVEIVAPEAGFPARFERALQPQHRELHAPEIIQTLFPVGEVANGHLWRYLFATNVLRAAYTGMPNDATYYRANDLPITFLALAHAAKYVSISERLYRYHFRRGTSGHAIDGLDHFRFLLSGVDPITGIASQVQAIASHLPEPEAVTKPYESARLHIIGNVLRYCMRDTSGSLQRECLSLLMAKVGELDAAHAAAGFCGEALTPLSLLTHEPSQPEKPVHSVMLVTMHLETGGLQSVLLEHATHLIEEGYRVTVAVLRNAGRDVELPAGVEFAQVGGANKVARLDDWLAVLRDHAVDMVIDHHILYNDNWPWFALTALAAGVPTIGWIHNFALRPLFDGNRRVSFLATHMRILLRTVTLSPTDVTFWKLQGVERVAYLPNPVSPLALAALEAGSPRELPKGRIELAWWGRLDRSTKQVQDLIATAAELRGRGIDFRLTIIGPDSKSLTGTELRRDAAVRGVGDVVEFLGEQSAPELVHTLSRTHLMVSTSAIEGYQLTIIEAQAMGLPVVMYDLPWLTTVRGNAGVVTTLPDNPGELADAIAFVAHDPERYAQLSRSACAFAREAATVDIGTLLRGLIEGTLPAEYSPAPSIEDAQLLAVWLVRIAERSIHGGRDGETTASGEAAALRRERDRAQRELKRVMDGPSFRVGRALTYLPRRLRDLLRPTAAPRSYNVSTTRKSAAAAPPPPLRAAEDATTPTRSPKPDVTFVIPVYNSAPWLEDCVTSVLAQSGVDVEVICINDGSTDESSEILHRLADADSRLTVVDQPNSGQSVGRNAGVDHATGRYIIYLDSDDYWPHDVLRDLVHRADEGDLDVLLFDCVTFRDGDVDEKVWQRYATYYQRSHAYRDVQSGAELMVAMRRGRDYRPHVGLYLARTQYLRETGLHFIPGIVHQDNPYTFRLLLNAPRAAHERVDAYARRIRPGSTITTLTAERSARGYYLSYLEMTRALRQLDLPADAASTVNNIVDYVYEGARKQFALLSDASAAELGRLDNDADAQVVYASLMESRVHADDRR